MKAVSVEFPYKLRGIPKGHRRVRDVLVWGHTNAVIPTASPSDMPEAKAAFRLELTNDNRHRYVERRQGLLQMSSAKEEVLIFRHQGNLWWPLKIERDRVRLGLSNLPDVLDQLVSREHDLLNMLPPRISHSAVVPRPEMQSVENDGCGLATAFVQRTIHENLLICDNTVFRRGGAPVFVKNRLSPKRSWQIQAVDPGPDRAARPVLLGSRTNFDIRTDWWIQAALREGLFWGADMGDRAKAAAHRTQIALPTVEIYEDEALSFNPSTMVLDAIFRYALETAEHWQNGPLVTLLAPGLEVMSDEDTNTRR
jgi:hypothetical protein